MEPALVGGRFIESTQVLHLCCAEIRIIFATQFEANVALEIFWAPK